MSDASNVPKNLRERLSGSTEERLGRALEELLESPLLTGAIGRAFDVREKAARELRDLGELAVPALREALAQRPSLEVRRRAEGILEELAELSADQRRAVRAVEALEHIGTQPARQVLGVLAGGAPQARLTREARAALRRLHGHCGDTR